MGKKISNVCRRVVRGIGIFLIGYLFLQGLFTICCIQRVSENTYFMENNVSRQLLGIVLFLVLTMVLCRKGIQTFLIKYGNVIFVGMLLLMTGFLVFWITQTQFWYSSDMERIFQCAARFREGDFSDWQPGGYLYMWSHQNGLFLLVVFLLHFFSVGTSFSVFYSINIFFYVITIVALWVCVRMLFEARDVNCVQILMLLCYLPYGFFCTFMYGNIIGFGFATVSMALALWYLRKRKITGLLGAAVCMVLAVVFKQNELIVFIGISILLFFDCLETKAPEWKRILALLGFMAVVLAGMKVPNMIVGQMTGVEPGAGNSKLAHIAMGLQDNEMRPGWYNGYNIELFEANNYDKEATSEAALANIKETVSGFVTDPASAWSFFNRKLASEWNNPTFECFNIQNARSTALDLSGLVKSTIHDGGKINILFILVFDIIQSVLLFGILMYLISADKAGWEQLLFCLLFIGGFVFFAFWEAKSQYVVPFFFLLIPYAYLGYRELAQRLLAKEKWNKLYAGMVMLAVLIIVITVTDSRFVQDSFKLHRNTDMYYEYIHQYNQNFMNLRF